MPQDLPLEPDLIKVLASDTRRDILRNLRERDMTVTELARELDLGKATVHEHLNKLTNAGLAERREDDRLWVYYRLTGEGKRMLNPQRTRFYLIVAVSALAGIAAILAIALFLSLGGGPGLPGESARDQAAGEPAFSVAVTEGEAYAGGPLAFDAIVQGAEAGTLTAYLVSPEDAEALRQGDTSVLGHPMTIRTASQAATAEAADADGTEPRADARKTGPVAQPVVLEGSAQLPAGTYLLYVRGAGLDNREAMPTVRVHDVELTLSTTTWYQGASQPLAMEIIRDGDPVLGTVRLVATTPTTGGQVSAELTGTTTHLGADLLDALPSGTYTLEVLPRGGDHWLPLEPKLRLVPAQLTATPLHLTGQDRVHLDLAPAGTPGLSPGQITVNTSLPFTLEPAGHGLTLGFAEAGPGTATVQAARLDGIELQVHRTPRLSLEIQDGPVWELHAETPAGEPWPGLEVHLDEELLGTTDASGNLTIDPLPEPDEHVLRLSDEGGGEHELGLHVAGWHPQALDPAVSVRPTEVQTHAAGATLTLQASNSGLATTHGTVHVEDEGEVLATAPVTVPGNASRTVVLGVPLAEPGEHQLRVTYQPLAPPSLLVTNATTTQEAERSDGGDGGADGGGGGGPAGGGSDGADGASPPPPTDGGDDADTMARQESALLQDGSVITVEVEDTATRAAASDEAGHLFEPVGGDPTSAVAEDGSAETPALGGLLAAVVVMVVAVAARARARR